MSETFMKKLGAYIIGNLDTLLAIVMSIAAATLGVFGGSMAYLLSAMAGVLGLLAYGSIRDRGAREELSKRVQDLNRRPTVRELFRDRAAYGPLSDTVASAQYLGLVGPSLVNIFSQWAGYLYSTKLNEQGATIHAIVLDPECQALESVAQCLCEPSDGLRRDIAVTMLRAEGMLKGEYGDGITRGQLVLRLTKASPNYSMLIIDPEKPNGRMFVEFIGYHSRLHARPHIELSRERDREWFEFFLAQFKALWRDSHDHLTIPAPSK